MEIRLPSQVTLTRFTVRSVNTRDGFNSVRDYYLAGLPGITPGIGPSAELAVTDVLRNYVAAWEETDETGRAELASDRSEDQETRS